MKDPDDFTIEQLRDLIDYCPQSGEFRWKPRPVSWFAEGGLGGAEGAHARWHGRFAGKPAFTSVDHSGHLYGRIRSTIYRAHRLAWAIHYGEWPRHYIDHIDGNPANNTIRNLRDVPHAENMKNRKKQENNRSGVTGVIRTQSGRWLAYIGGAKSREYLGTHDSIELAAEARQDALLQKGYLESHGINR